MPLMDEFKEEREALKNADFKTKLKYFWDYYKLHTIIGTCIVIFVVTMTYSVVTTKDYAFFAAMVNSTAVVPEDIAAFKEDYMAYAQIDPDEYEVQMDNTLMYKKTPTSELEVNASQRLMIYTSAGQLDAMVCGSDSFPHQASQGIFYDLREILTEEQLAKYEPYFCYVDQAIIDARNEIPTTGELDEIYPEAGDPRKPEEMENPIPVALFVTDCKKLTDTYYFEGDYIAVGVVANTTRLENAVKFIDFLFE